MQWRLEELTEQYAENKEYMLDQMNFERNVKQTLPNFTFYARWHWISHFHFYFFTFFDWHFYFAPSSSRK